ncbi:unnamed protein product [Sordaria macrospora k-hell]|uniref:WGS project CABT00000000 data, contig 2.213 n=1 Tax=Sordaria macrospora (strain ATCC MYA-333 / DSM 997 / K(L3346) / K-hell) TaxID=771870 RepID=F7WCR7_SORMK|nr:uncharacterized protein SMAC_09810 [Sordaria macrospora k-hell]CCC05689.1 unnamed protein product [Sordaria macrospora k-hell]
MPVWKTVQRTVPFWLVGIAPAEILGREIARTAARLHTLPVNHPLTERRLGTTVTGWSRLTSMANLHPPNGGGPRPLDPETPSASGMAEPGGGGPAQKTPHTDAPTGSRPRPVLADPQTAIPPGHPWHHNNPYLDLPRSYLARWIGEKTGHYDFHSIHNLKADGYTGARARADGSIYGIRTIRPETPDPDDEPLPLEMPGHAPAELEGINYDGRTVRRLEEDTEMEEEEEEGGE